MNFREPKISFKAMMGGIGSVFLICVAVTVMQPVLDRFLGGGTLLATNAVAEENLHTSGEAHQTHANATADKEPATHNAEQAQTLDPTREIFRDDPLATLTNALQKRQRELDERERRLMEEEERIKLLAAEVTKQIGELEQQRETLKTEMDQFQGQLAAQRAKDIKKWFEIYQSLSPERAAAVLEEMDEATAREILSKMDAKKATKILDAMNKEEAVNLVGVGLQKGNR